MSFYKGCTVNNDSTLEVFTQFDSEDHLFIAVYEDIPDKDAIREQSVYMTREQVVELIEHLNKALELPKFGEPKCPSSTYTPTVS